MKKKNTYFHNLDGLRFIASLFVILGHSQHLLEELNKTGAIYSPFADKMANFGVDFFFVLSGFLIGYLLFDEIERTQTVDIRKFYIRRILRLWPVYFLAGTLSILLGSWLAQVVNYDAKPQTGDEIWSNMLHLLTFSTNFQILWHEANTYTSAFIGHFWSLSVEEQFYLFFAPFVLLLHRRGYAWVSFTIFIAIGVFFHVKNSEYDAIFFTFNRFFHFGLGICYAYFVAKKWHLSRLERPVSEQKWLQWLFLIPASFYLFGEIYFPTQERIINGLVAVFLVATAIHSHSVMNLEQRWVKYLGKISFGIYVFHLFCVRWAAKLLLVNCALPIHSTKFIILFPMLATILSFGFAVLSYEFFEKYFLKLKSKFNA